MVLMSLSFILCQTLISVIPFFSSGTILNDLVREAFELLLEKKDPQRKMKRDSSIALRPQNGRNIKTRYVPERIKQVVHIRDEGQCSYTSLEGKKCGERNFLELDHIHPWSLGGDSTAENLRLLCRTHNQYRNQTLRV